MIRWVSLAILGVALCAVGLPSQAAAPPVQATSQPDEFNLTTPRTLADLRQLEARTQYVMNKVMPAVVGLGGGSGVIVEPKGTILTVAHVGSKANRDITLIFFDGKRAKGKTLGNYKAVDAGMATITEKGPWPFAELGKSNSLKPGMWCVAMGYPVSFSKGQKPPVRLGRILRVTPTAITTDCVLMGGDSGGPLFDMNGRVIGQNSRTAGGVTGNVHVPVNIYLDNWKRMMDGEDWEGSRIIPRRTGLALLEPFTSLLENEVREPAPKPRTIRTGPNERNQEAVRQAFAEATKPVGVSTVRVYGDGKSLAMGTIVSADGLIVTKASLLKGTLTVRLYDGTVLTATKWGEDKESDLAVLKVQRSGLTPVRWREKGIIGQGYLVAAVGEAGEALHVGTVTSEPRTFRINEKAATTTNAAYLGVTVEPSKEGIRLGSVTPKSAAEAAGLKAGDIIRLINGEPVKETTQLRNVISKLKAGDRISLVVRRGNAEEEIAPVLGKNTAAAPPYDKWGGGPFSSERRFGYGRVLPHDMPINPADVGGPIVDTNGEVVGINVSRALRISTYAILPEDVKRIVARIREKANEKSVDSGDDR
ncbi:MAG: trypsin-like peptidase domain-containing protein [Gemmataceae bacterium]